VPNPDPRAAQALATRRFDLEPLVPAHAEELFPGLSDAALYELIPDEPPASVAALRARFSRWEQRSSPSGAEIWLNYAIRERAAERYCGTLQASIVPGGIAYLAYLVFPSLWGRGIASETCTELIGFVFQTFGVQRMAAHVDARNGRSIGLLSRLRFRPMRTLVASDTPEGAVSDELVFELERSVWEGAGRAAVVG
jgi:ribosomal-protein-alanine N-acetyltransferase